MSGSLSMFREGKLHRITRDETMAQSLVDSGLPPESVDRFSHILLNSLGGGNEAARATIRQLALKSDDQLLLCSDGLTDMVSDEVISSELAGDRPSQITCDSLVARALENGGKDNVTVVLASVESLPQ